jgi:hypothetical protein
MKRRQGRGERIEEIGERREERGVRREEGGERRGEESERERERKRERERDRDMTREEEREREREKEREREERRAREREREREKERERDRDMTRACTYIFQDFFSGSRAQPTYPRRAQPLKSVVSPSQSNACTHLLSPHAPCGLSPSTVVCRAVACQVDPSCGILKLPERLLPFHRGLL